MKSQLILTCALTLAVNAAPAFAGTFESVKTGFWHETTAWNLVVGTDEGGDGIPSAGDIAVILPGNLIEMHEPHEATTVTVQGILRGSTNAAVFNLTHNLGDVIIAAGGEFDLADGREAEAVTVNITGDLTLEEGGQIKAAAFGDMSDITLNLSSNYIDHNIAGFALQGGGSTSWDFVFKGTEPSSLTMEPGASRDFGNIIVQNGKTLIQNSTNPVYITAGNTFTVETGASLYLVNGAFYSGPGNFTLDEGTTFGLAAAHGILKSSLFQNSGTSTLTESANYVFNGVGGQNTGADLPSAVNSLIIDTPDWVTLSQGVNVSGLLNLESGRLETNEYAVFAGENESQVVRNTGYVDGNLARTFDAANTGARFFPVGSETRYLPVTVDITNVGSGFGFLTVSAYDGEFSPAPEFPALPFHWNINGAAYSGFTAQLSFGYPEADAPAIETAIRMSRHSDGSYDLLPGQIVDTDANLVTVPGVSAFSTWVPVDGTSNVADWAVY